MCSVSMVVSGTINASGGNGVTSYTSDGIAPELSAAVFVVGMGHRPGAGNRTLPLKPARELRDPELPHKKTLEDRMGMVAVHRSLITVQLLDQQAVVAMVQQEYTVLTAKLG